MFFRGQADSDYVIYSEWTSKPALATTASPSFQSLQRRHEKHRWKGWIRMWAHPRTAQ